MTSIVRIVELNIKNIPYFCFVFASQVDPKVAFPKRSHPKVRFDKIHNFEDFFLKMIKCMFPLKHLKYQYAVKVRRHKP